MERSVSEWSVGDLKRRQLAVEYPEFQREPTLWNRTKKSRLIDSIIRGFDIASIYLFKKNGDTYDCIDGRQRINAILSYLGTNEDPTDNGFPVKIENSVYEDQGLYALFDNKSFDQLGPPQQDRIMNYRFHVVEISDVENPLELNLLFQRLQHGLVLNAGEKLHAMSGWMRNYVFDQLAKTAFFDHLDIPYRRFAKEQVACQVVFHYYSLKDTGSVGSARHVDLERFVRQHVACTGLDRQRTSEVEALLERLLQGLAGTEDVLTNRAVAVSAFLMVEQLVSQRREGQVAEFGSFLPLFLGRLRWQVRKGLDVDLPYRPLIRFQTYVTQATVERYAIERRQGILNEYFDHYLQDHEIIGDREYSNSEQTPQTY